MPSECEKSNRTEAAPAAGSAATMAASAQPRSVVPASRDEDLQKDMRFCK